MPLPESCCCFSPFVKAQGVMWGRTCVVQYLRRPMFHTLVCMKDEIRDDWIKNSMFAPAYR